MSQGVDRSIQIKLVVAIVLIVLALIIVLQNTAPVETRILFMTLEMPRAALLSLTLLIGMLVGSLVTLVVIRRERNKKQA
ncbi:MAG: lipopolysaccharide assembly protein LapA domain-containing protein [Wenzhouxiangella sp.]